MYCKNCGTELKEGQKFCPKCGTPVESSQTSRTTGAGQQQTYQQTQTSQQQNYQQQTYQQTYQQQDTPGKSDAIGSMVLGIIAIVFLFFGWSSVISVIMSIIGLILASNAKKKGYTGGMQTAGFVLCIINLFGGILIFIACVACTGLGIASLSLTY